jgi:ethanolamine ammonia-lyase large subunit
MLNYQSTSFHDAASVRRLFGLSPAPEFAAWLESLGGNLLQGHSLDHATASRRLLSTVEQLALLPAP